MPEQNEAAQRRSLLSWIWKIPFSSVIVTVFLIYLSHSLWSIYQIYYPKACLITEKCIKPSWNENTKFHAAVFVSTSKELRSSSGLTSIWTSKEFDISSLLTVDVNVTLPKQTLHNGSLYLHLLLTDESNARVRYDVSSLSYFEASLTATKSVAITKFVVPRSRAFNLLENQKVDEKPKKNPKQISKPITHWIHRLTVHVMSEPLSIAGISQEMYPHFQITSKKKYLPILFIDHFGLLEKDFYPVNSSSITMPLSFTFTPVTYGKMRLILIIDYSLKMLQRSGFSDKDADDVKAIFFDTNIYLLFITFIISGLHLLFDFLSFKNDISFWKNRKSNVGTSFRSLVWRCISQTIVFLYLYDQGTSLIVLVPAGISILIELWKVTKSLKIKLIRVSWWYGLEFGTISEEERLSDAYDSQGMKYLTWLVVPCCLIYALYSLVFMQHTSWFSWCIESVVNGVYTFGFVFMLPQLFVNYKLKSVSHLPWRAFMYKMFNTLVDDLFAFIITMPTAHRVACFRDDVVFIIYLYQRWLYPVDSQRQTEYSLSEEDSDGKLKQE